MDPKIENMQAELYKAISHPTRLDILNLLRDGEKCVCEIFPALDIGQPNVSRHLSVLKKEGLVSSRKEGLKVIYRVNNPAIFQLIDLTTDILKEHWQTRNRALA